MVDSEFKFMSDALFIDITRVLLYRFIFTSHVHSYTNNSSNKPQWCPNSIRFL